MGKKHGYKIDLNSSSTSILKIRKKICIFYWNLALVQWVVKQDLMVLRNQFRIDNNYTGCPNKL